jgi:hypothetical protein
MKERRNDVRSANRQGGENSEGRSKRQRIGDDLRLRKLRVAEPITS